MIAVKEAIKRVQKNTFSINQKVLKSVLKSCGFVLFEDIYSPINMPPFRQSAMDGYALCLNNDITYSVIDEVKAGNSHHPELNAGEAVRIFTGAPVPETANAVIMQEKVTIDGKKIILNKTVLFGENIRPLGEQIKKGEIALKKGAKLTPAAIGYLTSLGITDINVYKKPSIAIVVTGDELSEAGKPLTFGNIYESNSGMLLSALNSLGLANVTTHKVEDNYTNTLTKLDKVINQNDMVLITGGISVGDYDFVGKALKELEVREIFYKVKQKPGKPLFFGKKKDTIVFALPGNPAAALSCFYIYVISALQKMAGDLNYSLTKITAKSNSEHIRKGERSQFLKAILKEGRVTILEGQSSAMLHTFALANALVYISENQNNIMINDEVEVICLSV
ncbi:MAG: molybdopterin molybdenumtransferase MoeA [Bacteroidetes bacterium]|nr:MAG: molybdopterin molybdenumtransferase MoeA [Bacteroidota bacterium]